VYCPNCGVKLTNSNQKFCHNCGAELMDLFEVAERKKENIQVENSQPKEVIQPAPNYQSYNQKQVKISGSPGPYSKRSLGYSIVSLGLLLVGLNLGSAFRSMSYYLPQNIVVASLIAIVILNGIGLGFGIFGTTNSKKARYNESHNGLEVVGRIFGILGIVFNAIAFLLVAFIVPIFVL
jgi:hypothetical protein